MQPIIQTKLVLRSTVVFHCGISLWQNSSFKQLVDPVPASLIFSKLDFQAPQSQ